MDYSSLYNLFSVALLLIAFCFLFLTPESIKAQTIETDEQFEAYHHDIGRINPASPASSHVSPASIVKQLAPHPPPAPIIEQQAPVVVPLRQHSNSRLRPSLSGSIRLNSRVAANQESSAAALVPVVVAPSAASQAPQYSTVQDSIQYDQPALASFKASAASFNSAGRQYQQQQQQQVHTTYQPSFGVASQPSQASFNNVASLRSYPSATPAEVAPASAPVESSVPVYSSQHEPVAAASGQQQQHQGSTSLLSSSLDQLVAPSYEHILTNGCPSLGVFSYPHADHCDRYYMCTNGTFTEEACPNGLSYGTQGAVYQHCAYRWNIDCGTKKSPGPVSSPGCPWQFGVFPISSKPTCSIHYHECEWGVPEVKTCHPEGLFYDDRIKGCQWADQLGCKSEGLLNFKCPHEDEDNAYWPFPRYYHTKSDVIVCVNEQPRLVHCTEDQLVDPSSLACIDIKKKKKKF